MPRVPGRPPASHRATTTDQGTRRRPDLPPEFLDALDAAVMARDGRQHGDETAFRCPNPTSHHHGDRHPSARWNRTKAAWFCDVCGQGGGAVDLADRLGVARPIGKGGGRDTSSAVTGATVQPGLTVAALAATKRLPVDALRDHGLYDIHNYNGAKAVGIPYLDQDSEVAAVRIRIALTGDRFRWKKGSHPPLYGLWRLPNVRTRGWVLLVEGESDCWTAWHYGLPALGVPGKSTWKPEWAPLFDGLDVYLWQEPHAEDFAHRVGEHLPALKVIVAPDGYKDLNAAHVEDVDVPALVERLKHGTVPAAHLLAAHRQDELAVLKQAATAILTADDPLTLVEQGIRALGYGGDLKPPQITYLAATTRVLAVRPGTMLAHLLVIGPASAGKSYTVTVVLRLLPKAAYAVIDAGSPRVLIYDDTDYRHRVLVYGEADSIPAGEDNPAASAIRNLLQENRLTYKVVAKDPATGVYGVQTVDKPGPTVMITTATRNLGHQLGTRLFALDVPDDATQMRAALLAQGTLEEEGAPDADPALIAYQAYLQVLAPWEVVVPFARRLGALIGQAHTANRVLRDFQRLFSLIKAVAVLRHHHRQRDSTGRLIATIEDYAAVRMLVNHLYAATVSGGSHAVRETVEAVRDLTTDSDVPSALDVANQLGIHKATATRRINKAISEGWLINEEEKKGRPYRLKLGDPFPADIGLPDPQELATAGCTVAHETDAATALPSPVSGDTRTHQERAWGSDPADTSSVIHRNAETATGQPCVQCGQLVTVPGQLYCGKHGGLAWVAEDPETWPHWCCEEGCSQRCTPPHKYYCDQHMRTEAA